MRSECPNWHPPPISRAAGASTGLKALGWGAGRRGKVSPGTNRNWGLSEVRKVKAKRDLGRAHHWIASDDKGPRGPNWVRARGTDHLHPPERWEIIAGEIWRRKAGASGPRLHTGTGWRGQRREGRASRRAGTDHSRTVGRAHRGFTGELWPASHRAQRRTRATRDPHWVRSTPKPDEGGGQRPPIIHGREEP
jgi:hypothetical protein